MSYGFFVPALLGCYVLIIYYLWREERRLSSHSLSRPTAAFRAAMSSAVTEDVISKVDVDVAQEPGDRKEVRN